MKTENGVIVEISENELFSLYLSREMDDVMSFSEYQTRMENAGCVVIKEAELVRHGRWIKTERENACAMWTDFKCPVCGTIFDGNDWMFEKWKGCPVCLTRLDGGAE